MHVAGPGLDSEVPEAALLPLLGDPLHTLTHADTLSVQAVFDWHPSEAGALLVAAARGIRGVCGTRDAPHPVTLGDASPHVYRLTLARALEINPLARALAESASLADAERASERVCGFSEIARERARAAQLAQEAGESSGAAPRPVSHDPCHDPFRDPCPSASPSGNAGPRTAASPMSPRAASRRSSPCRRPN